MGILEDVGKKIIVQDHLGVAYPIFIVQQKRRIMGLDADYTDDFTYVDADDDGRELSAERIEELRLRPGADYFELDDDEPGIEKIGYIDIWEFVTACFTRAGAEAYIAANGHNLKSPRIYVESGSRNREWISMREELMKLATNGGA